MEKTYEDIQIRGFKLDYEDPTQKIIDNIDQIDIFALFNDDWIVIKKVTVKEGIVYLIKKDGSYVSFEQDDPLNSEALHALEKVSKAFKEHFKQYDQ